jgi:hypothetical protein
MILQVNFVAAKRVFFNVTQAHSAELFTGMPQVGNVDLKSATQQVIPALVTLGSDPNTDVKHATIEAFGAVAQHFKDEEVCNTENYSYYCMC